MKKNMQRLSFLTLLLLATLTITISGCVIVPEYQDTLYQGSDPMEPGSYANNVQAPQPLYYATPPDIVVVPSGDVSIYMLSSMPGVYFYQGRWYRNYNGLWYQAPEYNAIWRPIRATSVPYVIINVPPEYPVYLPPDYHRQRYQEFHDRWRTWDRDRYWQKQDWYRRESRTDTRRERLNRIEIERTKKRPENGNHEKYRQPSGNVPQQRQYDQHQRLNDQQQEQHKQRQDQLQRQEEQRQREQQLKQKQEQQQRQNQGLLEQQKQRQNQLQRQELQRQKEQQQKQKQEQQKQKQDLLQRQEQQRQKELQKQKQELLQRQESQKRQEQQHRQKEHQQNQQDKQDKQDR